MIERNNEDDKAEKSRKKIEREKIRGETRTTPTTQG